MNESIKIQEFDIVSIKPDIGLALCKRNPKNLKYYDRKTNTFCLGIIIDTTLLINKNQVVILPFKSFNDKNNNKTDKYKMMLVKGNNLIYHGSLSKNQVMEFKEMLTFNSNSSMSSMLYYQIDYNKEIFYKPTMYIRNKEENYEKQ